MSQYIDDDLIDAEEGEFSAVGRLVELGRQKGYVTIDDILELFPEAEQDVDQLEEAFAALLSAEIPYIEDISEIEPSDEELTEEEDSEKKSQEAIALEENILDNIDTSDMIGLYLKEVGKYPC